MLVSTTNSTEFISSSLPTTTRKSTRNSSITTKRITKVGVLGIESAQKIDVFQKESSPKTNTTEVADCTPNAQRTVMDSAMMFGGILHFNTTHYRYSYVGMVLSRSEYPLNIMVYFCSCLTSCQTLISSVLYRNLYNGIFQEVFKEL